MFLFQITVPFQYMWLDDVSFGTGSCSNQRRSILILVEFRAHDEHGSNIPMMQHLEIRYDQSAFFNPCWVIVQCSWKTLFASPTQKYQQIPVKCQQI